MTGLLETLITFVGAILVMALVSQSAIEIMKTVWPLKGRTREAALKKLLGECAAAQGLSDVDGESLYRRVVARMASLGQNGWWGVRLDVLEVKELKSLVESVPPAALPGLKDCPPDQNDPQGKTHPKLAAIAEKVDDWYSLAMEPVSSRYHRRMTVVNVVAATMLVIGLNADAFSLLDRARSDPDFRVGLAAQLVAIDSLMDRADSIADEAERAAVEGAVAEGGTPPAGSGPGAEDPMREELGRAMEALGTVASETASLLDFGGERPWGDWRWRLGIVVSILLVSLGAPFWHDLLGSLFGLKQSLGAASPTRSGGGSGSDTGAREPRTPA